MTLRASPRLKLAASSAAIVTCGASTSISEERKPSYRSVSAVEPRVPRMRAIRLLPPMTLITYEPAMLPIWRLSPPTKAVYLSLSTLRS